MFIWFWISAYLLVGTLVLVKCKGRVGKAVFASYLVLCLMGTFDFLYIADDLIGKVVDLTIYSFPLWFASKKHTKTLAECGVLLGVLILFSWEALEFMSYVRDLAYNYESAASINILSLLVVAISGFMGGSSGGSKRLSSSSRLHTTRHTHVELYSQTYNYSTPFINRS